MPIMNRVRWPARLRPRTPESWCELAVVLGAVVFVFSQVHPGLVLANTTPTGGDTGAHVFAPAYLRDDLLPSGRLTGWAPGWYAGFPLYTFYPVVPALLIVALGVLVPYGIAMKLVTLAGTLLLPVAAYAMGRLARLRFPAPAVLAAATVPFLFDRSFSIYGGNIQSTLAGEFSFSLALSLSLVTFGLVVRALRTGRGRATALAAASLGLTVVCHPIVAFYTAVGVATIVLFHLSRRRLAQSAALSVVAFLLSAWWVLPFLARRGYMSTMGFQPLPGQGQSSVDFLAPPHLRWVLAVAFLGVVASVVQRQRLGLALGANAVIFAAIFPHFPDVGLWNARLLPFYFLCVYLLAGLGAVAIGRLAAFGLRRFDAETARWSLIGTPAAVLAFTVVLVGLPLHALPGGSLNGDRYQWLGLSTTETSVIPAWSQQNYGGYERAGAWPEYHAIMSTMTDVGRSHGCGRADWEYDQSLGRYGTPDAMMLLPYWTHGCVDSMEGLYYESSATTPYHFLTAAEISEHPSDPMAGLPYSGFDLFNGVAHMQLLGVRYYMAFSAPAVKAAAELHSLRQIATSGPWHVYELTDSSVVSPLASQPVVTRTKHWQRTAVSWFTRYADDPRQPVLTASGPSDWQRVDGAQPAAAVTLPPIDVTDVKAGDFDVTFDVSRPGVPVLVKVSDFPNWSVSGARGPYRATPNLMVVVPTSTHVHLHYGYTAVDVGSWLLTLLGLAGLVLLARGRSVRLPRRRRAAPAVGPERPAEADQPDHGPRHAAQH